jgi:hypothetical protein
MKPWVAQFFAAIIVGLTTLIAFCTISHIAHMARVGTTCHTSATAQALTHALHSGDIVYACIRQSAPIAKFVNAFTGTCFYHVGIVVEQGSTKYLLHYVDPAYNDFFQPKPLGCGLRPSGEGAANNLNPCLSEISSLLERGAKYDTRILVRTYNGSLSSNDIMGLARRIGCGRPYDQRFYLSYFTQRYKRDVVVLHCNTFIGLLLEAMGELPPSPHPVRDYVPGRLWQKVLDAAPSYATTMARRASFCAQVI